MIAAVCTVSAAWFLVWQRIEIDPQKQEVRSVTLLDTRVVGFASITSVDVANPWLPVLFGEWGGGGSVVILRLAHGRPLRVVGAASWAGFNSWTVAQQIADLVGAPLPAVL